MPITSITTANFKGIADPVTIPISPITLLFGKNSAGKSTILQALHYLREVLENRRPDPDRTLVGGDVIDLGGFQALVHRHELDRRIRIHVAFSLDDDGIPNNGITVSGKDTEELQSLSCHC
jgi:predicted ATPase